MCLMLAFGDALAMQHDYTFDPESIDVPWVYSKLKGTNSPSTKITSYMTDLHGDGKNG